MGLRNASAIAISGINAEKTHVEMIASNLANINSTNSVDGGPYRRKTVSFSEKPVEFEKELESATNRLESRSGGVAANVIEDTRTPMQKVYNPGHPDADQNGYVTMPNVSMATEMTDLVYASKLYEANITMFTTIRKMNQDALTIQ